MMRSKLLLGPALGAPNLISISPVAGLMRQPYKSNPAARAPRSARVRSACLKVARRASMAVLCCLRWRRVYLPSLARIPAFNLPHFLG
ncbi:MAG: hypothetical protein ABIT04_10080, partial [Novosphingobium sp.]